MLVLNKPQRGLGSPVKLNSECFDSAQHDKEKLKMDASTLLSMTKKMTKEIENGKNSHNARLH